SRSRKPRYNWASSPRRNSIASLIRRKWSSPTWRAKHRPRGRIEHLACPGLDLARRLPPGRPWSWGLRIRGLREAEMTLAQRCNLVLAFARVLYVNGQATEQTVAAAEQLGRTL